MTEHAGAERAPADEEALEVVAARRIEQLLGELEESSGPSTWPKVQRLVESILGVHGAAIGRILGYAASSAAGGDGLLSARLAGDELVAAILALHGLHPLGVEERISRGLERVFAELPGTAAALESIRLREDGSVEVTLAPRPGAGADEERTLAAAVRRTIEGVAPEVPRVDLLGVAGAALHAREELVQLGGLRASGGGHG